MTWQTGTANSHIDFQNAIRDIATNRHMATAAINAAGTGYVVGEVLTVTGGTFLSTFQATVEVLTVGGSGDITSIRINTGGAYTVDPTLTGVATTASASGTGATLDITMAATGWTIERESERVLTVAINQGGLTYTVGDTLTLVGGLGIGTSNAVTAATFTVDSVGVNNVITGISLADGGNYEEPLGTLTDVAVTGGTGNGATVDVTFGVAITNKWLVMSGAAAGAGDDVTVGIRTYETLAAGGGNAANFSLIGFESFNTGLLVEQQSNRSPGVTSSGEVDSAQGAYVPLVESAGLAMNFWLSITDRRITGVARTVEGLTTHYMSFYLGLANQFGSATDKPYPIYVAGSTSRHDTRFSETSPALQSGITECFGVTGFSGPAWYRRTSDGVWQEVRNGNQSTAGARSAASIATVYPAGTQRYNASEQGWDFIANEGLFNFDNLISKTGADPTQRLIPTPDSGGAKRVLFPATVVLTDALEDRYELFGELEGVFWFDFTDPNNLGSPEGVSEDTFTVGGTKYRIFQNGAQVDTYSYMAIRED